MAYQVLARKWRPRSFKEMAGQSHVLKTLINSLDNNRLHHAYLFTGTRGVGKTTIARILARCLNCETGITSQPCGECSACTEIDEGRFIDLIEVDAASRTRVEDTRELLDNVQYAPSRGRFKVYLIDEVHMLSAHSFNALLKTLEEPPPHVKFLLATTDPQKLPITVLSRCLQFSLKNLSPETLVEHMSFILDQEKIEFEEAALWQIGRAAHGSVRDGLTLLDQVIGFCNGIITDSEVSVLLGSIDQAIIHKLVGSLIAQDAQALLTVIGSSAEHSPDFAVVLEDLLSYLHRVAIAQVIPEGIDNSQGDRAQVLQHAQQLTAENIQLYYQMALKGREELPLSIDARSGLEMTLLRMLAFTPESVPPFPDEALQLEKKKNLTHSEPEETLTVRPRAEPLEQNVEHELEVVSKTVAPQTRPKRETAQLVSIAKPASADSAIQVSVSSHQDSELVSVTDLKDLSPEAWIPLFFALKLNGITQEIAANCVLISVDKQKLKMLLAENRAAVYSEDRKLQIQTALSQYFSTAITLEIEIANSEIESPGAFRIRKDQERLQQAVVSFQDDANVKEIISRFSGTIQTESIEPLTPKLP